MLIAFTFVLLMCPSHRETSSERIANNTSIFEFLLEEKLKSPQNSLSATKNFNQYAKHSNNAGSVPAHDSVFVLLPNCKPFGGPPTLP